jgi:hypothetical protein
MKRKGMDFAVTWLPILGACLFAYGLAVWGFTNGNRTVALWMGTAGVGMIVLAMALQLQLSIWKAEASDPNRPFITIMSLGFPGVLIQPGQVVILWEIKNTGGVPTTVTAANMTIWFETTKDPLPEEPFYRPNDHSFAGASLNKDEVLNAHLMSGVFITQETIDELNAGRARLFVYGFVRYGPSYERAFIARYNPQNVPAAGMFNRVEGEHPKYGRNS